MTTDARFDSTDSAHGQKMLIFSDIHSNPAAQGKEVQFSLAVCSVLSSTRTGHAHLLTCLFCFLQESWASTSRHCTRRSQGQRTPESFSLEASPSIRHGHLYVTFFEFTIRDDVRSMHQSHASNCEGHDHFHRKHQS